MYRFGACEKYQWSVLFYKKNRSSILNFAILNKSAGAGFDFGENEPRDTDVLL